MHGGSGWKSMNQHLFVYGTLMPHAGHPMGARLARESRLLGGAAMRGRLFDLGRYPALVEDGSGEGLVHGEVYALNSPSASLRWIDRYEGIIPGRESGSDYERVQRRASLETGGTILAWVYVYRAPLTSARPIENGRWRAQALQRVRRSG